MEFNTPILTKTSLIVFLANREAYSSVEYTCNWLSDYMYFLIIFQEDKIQEKVSIIYVVTVF